MQGRRAPPAEEKVMVMKGTTGGHGLVQKADTVTDYAWGPKALSSLPLPLVYPTTIF